MYLRRDQLPQNGCRRFLHKSAARQLLCVTFQPQLVLMQGGRVTNAFLYASMLSFALKKGYVVAAASCRGRMYANEYLSQVLCGRRSHWNKHIEKINVQRNSDFQVAHSGMRGLTWTLVLFLVKALTHVRSSVCCSEVAIFVGECGPVFDWLLVCKARDGEGVERFAYGEWMVE